LYKSKSVSIKQFVDRNDGIQIETILNVYSKDKEEKTNKLYNWLHENIEYKRNQMIKKDGKNICIKIHN
jgi:hypothetical protein